MFFFSGDFAFNCSPVHDKVLGKAGDVFRKMADSNPIFHDRDAVLVAELSSIGIRLRRQLFASYRIPVDPVYMIASNNTRVYEFHVEWMVTDRPDIWVLCRKFSAWHHMGYWILKNIMPNFDSGVLRQTAGYVKSGHSQTRTCPTAINWDMPWENLSLVLCDNEVTDRPAQIID